MTTQDRATYDINQPQDKRGKARTELNPKEIALLSRLSGLSIAGELISPNNKHLAFIFANSIQTIKNELVTLYRVINVENRSSAILHWQKIASNYNLSLNPHWLDSERILAKYQTIEEFRLGSDQWNSNSSSAGYPTVMNK